jgi:hypothetical protein
VFLLVGTRHGGRDWLCWAGSIIITVVDAEKGIVAPYPPHVMFYGPYMTNADLGSDGSPHGPAFVAGEGTPHALIIVPVPTGAHPNHASSEKGASSQR